MILKRRLVLIAAFLVVLAFVWSVHVLWMSDVHFSKLPQQVMNSIPKFLYKSFHNFSSFTGNLDSVVSEELSRTSQVIDFKDLGNSKEKVLLLIIVSTAPQRLDRRQAIRDTWWKHCTGDEVKCVFITDGSVEDQDQHMRVMQERNRYKDIELQPLQGGREFGLRFLNQIKWAKAKFDFQHLLRMDDDYFLCLKRLIAELPTRPKEHLIWGYFHCEAGITWIDEAFMIFSQDVIYKFLSQNDSTMLCHVHADQQIGLWLNNIPEMDLLYFHDTRLYHHPPASFSPQFDNITNVCDWYLALHGTYEEKMRYFGLNENDGTKNVFPIPNFSFFCQTTRFDYRQFEPKFRFEPKPCKDNPSWGLERTMFVGRENST